MSLMLQVMAAAEPAAATPPDYTPALLGLAGVIVGGIIQTIAQIVKERSLRVNETRAKVMAFAHEAFQYVGLLSQLADLRTGGRWGQMPRDQKLETASELTTLLASVRASGVALVGAADYRIADYASDVVNDILAYSDAHQTLFHGEPRACDNPYPPNDHVILQINKLMNMVTPRFFERHARFRSVGAATRLIEKAAAK